MAVIPTRDKLRIHLHKKKHYFERVRKIVTFAWPTQMELNKRFGLKFAIVTGY